MGRLSGLGRKAAVLLGLPIKGLHHSSQPRHVSIHVAGHSFLQIKDVQMGASAQERERARRLSGRLETEEDERRTPHQRDRDRILYSSSFRRLADVTQVAAAQETHLLHNRLTHSLKVAQIGRRIAERLEGQVKDCQDIFLDPDVVEAAGLAHDIGHPPFGHIAEDELSGLVDGKCCSSMTEAGVLGGFEGNAQSFRIVCKTAVRRQGEDGLDLTRATLNALLKYPRLRPKYGSDKVELEGAWTNRSESPNWGVYESERSAFDFARENNGGTEVRGDIRSPEAILMDWADDVSYATHDIEDYVRAGLISFTDLQKTEDQSLIKASSYLANEYGKSFDTDRFSAAWHALRPTVFQHKPFSGSRRDRAALHEFTATQVRNFVTAVQVSPLPPYLTIDLDMQYQVEALKCLNRLYVLEGPALAAVQEGQRTIIRGLFSVLYGWLDSKKESTRAPRGLIELSQQLEHDSEGVIPHTSGRDAYLRARAVADYICTLTEGQARDMYERVSGGARASVFGAWFQ